MSTFWSFPSGPAVSRGALLVTITASTALAGPPTPNTIGQRWTNTLNEEFNGTTLNSSIWTASTQDGRPNGNNGVTWGWNASNVALQNGRLRIQATADGDGTYSSGHIWTKDKWSQLYGYFEANVRLPAANNGHQAAFWMTPQNEGHFTVGNEGRDGAEIDIVETPDASDHYRTGLHWDGYGADHQSAGAQHAAPGIHTGYHDFGLLWDADSLKYYYDGELVRTYTGVGVPRVASVLRASVGILDWVDGDIRNASLPQGTFFERINAWQLRSDGVEVVDDTSTDVQLVGSEWQRKTSASDHDGTMTQSGNAGDAAVFTFNGTAVDVFVRKGQFGGIVDVYLDGQLVLNNFDTYAGSADYQSLLYSVDALDPGLHTIRLEATGQRNASAVGSLLMLDAIQFVAVPEPASLAILGLTALIIGRRRRRA